MRTARSTVPLAVLLMSLLAGCSTQPDGDPNLLLVSPSSTVSAEASPSSSAAPHSSTASTVAASSPTPRPLPTKSAAPAGPTIGTQPYVGVWSRDRIDDGSNAGPRVELTIHADGVADSATYIEGVCKSAGQVKQCGYTERLKVQIVKGHSLLPFTSLLPGMPTPSLLRLTQIDKSYFVVEGDKRTAITSRQFVALSGGDELAQQLPQAGSYLKVTRERAGLLGVIPPDESEPAVYYCARDVAAADRPKCYRNG